MPGQRGLLRKGLFQVSGPAERTPVNGVARIKRPWWMTTASEEVAWPRLLPVWRGLAMRVEEASLCTITKRTIWDVVQNSSLFVRLSRLHIRPWRPKAIIVWRLWGLLRGPVMAFITELWGVCRDMLPRISVLTVRVVHRLGWEAYEKGAHFTL